MIFLKKLACILLVLTLCCSLFGCKDKSAEAIIYFEFSDIPKTADPQTASSESELMLVRNIYEGLMRKDKNGKIVKGAAEKYSKDGLTYTFNIRKDAKWDDGSRVTAHDFVFAFIRAVTPETNSPFADRLKCIDGAEQILKGNAAPETLGVTAKNGSTLVITLCREDEDFLETLTMAPCMPCNKDFFEESKGKYGLARDYIRSNGTYYLARWNQQDFGIRLYKNSEYSGNFTAKNGGVFLSKSDELDNLNSLLEGNVDATALKGNDISTATKQGFKQIGSENICWILTISKEYPYDIRKALLSLIDKSIYEYDLPDGMHVADSFYPAALNLSEDISKKGFPEYNIESSKALFSNAVRTMPDKKFPSTVLYYYSNPYIKNAVTSIVGHWQQNLSAFINIEESTSLEALQKQTVSPTLQMAVFPINTSSASVKQYLYNYGISSSSAIEVQTNLLKDYYILPLVFEKTTVVYSSELSNIVMDAGNGYIDFSWVVKK